MFEFPDCMQQFLSWQTCNLKQGQKDGENEVCYVCVRLTPGMEEARKVI